MEARRQQIPIQFLEKITVMLQIHTHKHKHIHADKNKIFYQVILTNLSGRHTDSCFIIILQIISHMFHAFLCIFNEFFNKTFKSTKR